MKGNWMWYVFILILVFLLVVYYKGSTSIGGTLFQGLNRSILYLQGRSDNGALTQYPQGG